MIELKHINLSYHKPLIIDGTLELPDHSITAIIGKSGLGKSTLLNQLGFIDPNWKNHCEYYLDGQLLNNQSVVNLYRNHYFYLFQSNNLVEEMTCYDNLLFLASMKNIPVNKESIYSLFDRLQVDIDLEQYPNMISGGQRQKLEIVMLALLKPKVILCDEITSALDPESAKEIFLMLKEVVYEIGSTCVVVTHDPRIYNQCDNVYEIKGTQLVKNRFTPEDSKLNLSVSNPIHLDTYLNYVYLKLINKAFLEKSLVVGIMFAIMISSFNLIYRYSDENKDKLATSMLYDTNQEFIYDSSIELSFQGTPYLEEVNENIVVQVGNSPMELAKHIIIEKDEKGVYINTILADQLGINTLSNLDTITFTVCNEEITANIIGVIRNDYSEDELAHIYIPQGSDIVNIESTELMMYYEKDKNNLESIYNEITSHHLTIYNSLKDYSRMLEKNSQIDFYINILLVAVAMILVVFSIIYSIIQYEAKKKEITLLYNRGFRLGSLTLLNISENTPILLIILLGSPIMSYLVGKSLEANDILMRSTGSIILQYLILTLFTALLVIGLSQFMISLIYTQVQKKQY